MTTVKEIMDSGIPTIKPDTLMPEILHLMEKNCVYGLAVEENKRILGIVTDGDLLSVYLRHIGAFSHEPKFEEQLRDKISNYKQLCAKDVMTLHPRTINQNDDVNKAANIIKQLKYRRLIVVNDKNEYVGLVSRVAIIKTVLEEK
ncbi:MAG: CBS domain-containing protein [Candidatus Micrarchaeota archaeon]